ncbi:MAG: WHG domain-containing protein [Gemmatimonadota bacterium]|jgi:AcrR family transcriptional regulator
MPRAGLTHDKVVARAAEVADEEGYDALTLAAVADRFGVRVPSLYKHVDGLDGLRKGVAVLAVRELAERLAGSAVGKAGSDALSALSEAYRAYAHRHPGRYTATLRAPDPDDEALQAASSAVLDVVFAVLGGYGLDGDDAVDATRILRSALHGFVSLEAAGGFGLPREVDRTFQRLVQGVDAAFRSWADPSPTTG